jgi:Asp-tRNA(Asn)/Glu-tRNA(Gln) amidotransferase B subunit
VLADRFASWPGQHQISEADADLLSGDRATGDLFIEAVATGAPAKAVARWIINDLSHALADRDLSASPMTGAAFGRLVVVAESGAINGGAAKEVLAELLARGGDPEEIIAARGLAQVSDEESIAAIVEQVLDANGDKVGQYRAGKAALLGFFVGQVVRASHGRANPQVVQKLLVERLAPQ